MDVDTEQTQAFSEVEVTAGRLRGVVSRGVKNFKGIPYASPPTGPHRFAAPRPAEPWHDVRDATEFAAPSVQAALESIDGKLVVSESRVIGSEDCLYLNVYAPAAEGRYPVLVWIHGGGGLMGTTNDYDGTGLASAGVVLVTIAYRLGALGLLYLPGVFGETAEGNFAILDQIAALQWVSQNIAAFGGNPDRVTVAGQSNGARTIGTLLSVPSASGLFSQAVMMSGTGLGHLISDEAEAELVTTSMLSELSLEPSDVRRLRDLPAQQIVAAQTQLVRTWPTLLPFQAVIDGAIIPERPIDAIRHGAAKDVALLIGTTHDEYESFALGSGGLGTYRSMVVDADALNTATNAYRHLLPPDWTDAEVAAHTLTSADWWIPAIRVAEEHAATGGTVWMYRLDWRLAPRGHGLGAPHGLDVPVMARPDAPSNAFTPSDDDAPRFRSVIGAMRRALAAFVTGGNLSSWRWLPYEQSRRSTYLFDDLSHAEFDPDRDLRLVWQDLL